MIKKTLPTILIIMFVIIGLFITNYVSADNENTEKPKSTLLNNSQIHQDTPKPASAIPLLIQTEIEKLKTLRERTAEETRNIIEDEGMNQNRNQGIGSTTNQSRPEGNDQMGRNRSEQISKYALKITERFEALIAREEQIKNRIQSRILKLENDGLNMEAVRTLLEETNGEFGQVKIRIEAMRSDIATTIESSDLENSVEALFERVKTETMNLKEEVRNIHTSLVQSVSTTRKELSEQHIVDNSDNNSENEESNEN